MIAISTIVLLFVLSTCNGRMIFNEECSNDTIDFTTKVENSSFVVFGKSREKALASGSDTMFNIQFQVDCIFKGPAIPRDIKITRAGRIEGKTYCQDFPAGRGYSIAFLERDPLDVNDTHVFIPADFVEVPYQGNVSHELFVNTCGLHQVLPLESSAAISDLCPAVSTGSHCIPIELSTVSSGLHPVVIPGEPKHGMDDIRSKSGTIQVEVDTKNGVNSIHISILLIFFITITLLQLN